MISPAELAYLTPREFAAISRYSVTYLAKIRHEDGARRRAGKATVGPPYVKPRGKVLYPQTAALAWLDSTNGVAS